MYPIIFRVHILVINILITVSLLAIYYKPDIVQILRFKFLHDLKQQRLVKSLKNENLKQIMGILIALSKSQLYPNNLVLGKINYNDQQNQMQVMINSQSLEIIDNYLLAMRQSLGATAYISMVQTVDNTHQDLLRNYLTNHKNQNAQALSDHDDEIVASSNNLDRDFNYTTTFKIVL